MVEEILRSLVADFVCEVEASDAVAAVQQPVSLASVIYDLAERLGITAPPSVRIAIEQGS